MSRRLIACALALAVALAPVLGHNARAVPGPDVSSPQAIEETFQRGLQALAGGDPGTAIRLFRAILAEDADLPRVRLELARAYFNAREWEKSRGEFFAVLSGDIPKTVKENIIKFLQAIDARRGFDWNLSIGLSASPQAQRKYDSNTIDINFLGVPLPAKVQRDRDGDYGVQIDGSAEYRYALEGLSGPDVRVTALAQAFADVFEGNGNAADDYQLGGGLGLRGAWAQTTATATAVVSGRMYGGEHYQDRYEVRGNVEWRGTSGLSLFAGAAVGYLDDQITDDRDGRSARLRLGVAHSIGGRSIIGLALDGEDFAADKAWESYLTTSVEAFGSTDLGGGFNASGRIFALNQDYDARNPLLFEARKEQEYGLDIELSKVDTFLFGQFTPFVKVGFSRRNSSIDAYSYTEQRFNVGIRKTF